MEHTIAVDQGALWSTDPEGWAIEDDLAAPVFAAVVDAASVGTGDHLLEVGCATGRLLEIAAARGASVVGLDAAAGLLEIARRRVPHAELHVGDVQALPYREATFDVVVGCNVFQFADDVPLAFGEAARVLKPGGRLAVQMWGSPDRCELLAVMGAVAQFLPFRLPGPPGGGNYSDAGVLERLTAAAGLRPLRTGDLTCAFEYADEAQLLRVIFAAGLTGLAVREGGEDAVRAAALAAAEPFRSATGTYRFANEWHWLIAER